MNFRSASLASFALALLLCFCGAGSVRAVAAVLPQARIDAAIASEKRLHPKNPPIPGSPHPYYVVDGSDAQGFLDPTIFDYGYLANGTDVLIMPMVSGGSGGVFYTLLFTSIATKPAFIGYVPSMSGHLDVYINQGRLLVETPVFKGKDFNCCPSGHHVVVYTVVGTTLKKIDQYDL
jgi:hypothetical protein